MEESVTEGKLCPFVMDSFLRTFLFFAILGK